jgi:hypothetical protein
MHDVPVVLHAVSSGPPAWLGGLADQHVVGGGCRAGPDAQEGIERGVPGPAPIKAEDEFVQIVLEVDPSQSVVHPQTPSA